MKNESVSRSAVSDSLKPTDCSPPGSSVHGILQARILVWVATPFSRDLSNPGLPHWRQILYSLSQGTHRLGLKTKPRGWCARRPSERAMWSTLLSAHPWVPAGTGSPCSTVRNPRVPSFLPTDSLVGCLTAIWKAIPACISSPLPVIQSTQSINYLNNSISLLQKKTKTKTFKSFTGHWVLIQGLRYTIKKKRQTSDLKGDVPWTACGPRCHGGQAETLVAQGATLLCQSITSQEGLEGSAFFLRGLSSHGHSLGC